MLASNKKNIIRILILLFIMINIFAMSSFAVVSPTKDFYVNDYAGLLDAETKKYIINASKSLDEQTGAQIVVVTIPSLENRAIEDYATELFRNFGIGDKTKNNGLLLLLALKERKFRVEVGYGLEGDLPDAKTGRIQDEYIIPYLKQNNWKDGIKNGYSAFLEIVAKKYNVNVEAQEAIARKNADENNEQIMPILMTFVFSVFCGSTFGALRKKEIIDKKSLKVFCFTYLFILFIVCMIIFNDTTILNIERNFKGRLTFAGIMEVFNIICLIIGFFIGKKTGINGGSFGGGIYFGGGSSFEGGSSGRGGSSGGGGSTRSF